MQSHTRCHFKNQHKNLYNNWQTYTDKAYMPPQLQFINSRGRREYISACALLHRHTVSTRKNMFFKCNMQIHTYTQIHRYIYIHIDTNIHTRKIKIKVCFAKYEIALGCCSRRKKKMFSNKDFAIKVSSVKHAIVPRCSLFQENSAKRPESYIVLGR